MKSECEDLKEVLKRIVDEDPAEGLLLSGGLDTSIIAFLASNHLKKAFTVGLEGGEDIKYAKIVAEFLDLDHDVYLFDEEEMLRTIPDVVRILGAHQDFWVRGGVPVLIAMKKARECGIDSIYAGDGADELFAGYSSMTSLISSVTSDDSFEFDDEFGREYLNFLLQYLGDYLRGPHELGKSLGIDVISPYLNEKMISYAMEIPLDYKVRRYRGKIWGKWILRKAFEDDLPDEIVWREKTPIDIGTGSMKIRDIIDDKISDEEFERKMRIYLDAEIGTKEELFYYEILRGGKYR
jgi:asparagine synthase (glutamine-hydrolysing)